MTLTFRRATREDVVEIVRMMADDALGSRRECYEKPLPQVYYDVFAEIDADKNHELMVAESDGVVVGTLHLTFLPSLSFTGGLRAQIESVRVDQCVRGEGIGTRFFEWAIARAKERGCRLVQLSAHKDRQDAHRFYERLGFVASHEGMKISL